MELRAGSMDDDGHLSELLGVPQISFHILQIWNKLFLTPTHRAECGKLQTADAFPSTLLPKMSNQS